MTGRSTVAGRWLLAIAPRHAQKAAVEIEQAAPGVIIGKAVIFGEIADALADCRGAGRLAEHVRLAVGGADDAQEQLDHRRLAGAVLAEAAEDLAAVDVERHAAERLDPAVVLDEILDLDDRLAVGAAPRRFGRDGVAVGSGAAHERDVLRVHRPDPRDPEGRARGRF